MPIVAVVVIIVAVTAVVASADGEIRATAAVDPDAAVIKAPSLSEDAGRFAATANQADTIVGIDAAAAEVEVIRRAVEGADAAVATVISVIPGADGKISTTAAVDPDPVAGDAPGPAIDARGFALLADEFDAAVGVDGAEMEIEIIRRAVKPIGMRTGHGAKCAAGKRI